MSDQDTIRAALGEFAPLIADLGVRLPERARLVGLVTDAAVALDSLVARLAEAEREAAEWHRCFDVLHDDLDTAEARLRLTEEALRRIADDPDVAYDEVGRIARAALAHPEDSGSSKSFHADRPPGRVDG